MRERPAEHLDRAWPGTDRATSKQVADERMFAGTSPVVSVVNVTPGADCDRRLLCGWELALVWKFSAPSTPARRWR